MPPLNVLITVDTETWPKAPDWIGPGLMEEIRRDVYGITAGGEYGLSHQMDVLDAHDLKAVFLVESLFASATGVGPLREMVALIQGRGHEVQLHIHPEWLEWMPDSTLPAWAGDDMKDYTEEEQVLLIARGLDNLRRAGAVDPCAFRAGNYGVDLATLRALARNRVRFDTSYNVDYLDTARGLRLPDLLLQPRTIDGVCEVPISFFSDWPGHYRPAQLGACSDRELRQALLQAWRRGWHSFVLVSHSFELLRGRGRLEVFPRPDRIVVRRFESLCRFLAGNREKFRTVGFSDLEPSPIAPPDATRPLQTGLHLTILRYGEQLARRLQR